MTECYGILWEKNNGHVGGNVFESWRHSLRDLSLDQIKNGLEGVIAEGHEFPPNLIKFMRLCRDSKPASHNPFLPEPPITQTPDIAQDHLAKMREAAGLPEKPLSGWKQPKPDGLLE